MSLREVFLSHVGVLFYLNVTKKWDSRHGYHPENCAKFFVMTMV